MRSCPRGSRRSVDRGAHRPAIEPRKSPILGADAVQIAEGNTSRRVIAIGNSHGAERICGATAYRFCAVKTLAGIMNEPEAPAAARVAAANALLDRGWGKATQPIAGDETSGPIVIRWQK